jgi:thioester reductase-like protein
VTRDNTTPPPTILPLSARSETALGHTAAALATFLDGDQDACLDDVVTTLVHGREEFPQRLAVVADGPSAAVRALRESPSVSSGQGRACRASRTASWAVRSIFAFTGEGTQYTGMAAGAYAAFPEFRDWLDRADTLLTGELPAALLDCLFKPELADTLARTDVAATAIVAVQLGLVRVLGRYGITPDAVIGHGSGEFCAAVVSGAVSAEDALRLVARRSVLTAERAKPGAMLSVRCDPTATSGEDTALGGWDMAAVTALAAEAHEVCVAAVNSPRDLVLSGDPDSLAAIESRLGEAGLRTRRLRVSHALYCGRLAVAAAPFAVEAESVAWSAPTQARWISCSRGPVSAPPDARFWRDQLTEPVRFWDALTLACADDRPGVLVEIGPHPELLPFAAQLAAPPAVVPVLDRDHDAAFTVAAAAAEAWCTGAPADLTGGTPGRRIHLPGYGFVRRVHSPRPEPQSPAQSQNAGSPSQNAGGRIPERGGLARPARDLLAEIWTDLLGTAPEPDTAFVECGGDSLILLNLQRQIQESLGEAPSLEDLLEAGTFEAMASLLPASAPARAPAAHDGAAHDDAASPVPRPLDVTAASYRPSAAQQSMLFIDLMQQNSNQHNVTLAIEISGRADGTAMAAAFRDAQVRHAALRTVFVRQGSEFRAEIAAEPGAELTVIDAGAAGIRPLEDDRDIREWARDISDPPVRCLGTIPVRGTLVRGPARSLLVITAHHAVSDATSVGVMLEELAGDYRRYRAGMPSQAVPAPVQFHELAALSQQAQSRQASDAEDAADRAYWRDKLAGAPDLVPLPTDRPRPEVRAGSGAQWSWNLDGELSARVRELATDLNATLFSTMLAAYAALLRVHSGAGDLCIATPVTGRTTAESQRVFGLLVNTLVLRVRIAPGQTFDALVREVQATVLEGIRHSAFPFDKLVAELNPQRDPGKTPLFSVMFAMPTQFGLPDFDGQPSSPVELPGLGAKFDLTLYVTPAADGCMRLDLEYDPALFDEPTVRDIAADYNALLAALSAVPTAVVPDAGSAPAGTPPQSGDSETDGAGLNEMERYVAGLWSQTLNAEVSRADDDFFALGGHSMLVLACLVEIQDRFPDATIQDFFAHRTVRTFAARLQALAPGNAPGNAAGEAADEAREPSPAAPDNAIETERRYPARQPSHGTNGKNDVLLTGATGFLGSHLLAALLRKPEGKVVCLLRPRDGVAEMDRLRDALARYAPDIVPELRDRVTVIGTDLNDLDPGRLEPATANVGTVVHSAAETKMFGRIEDFRAVNVTPTRRLAELARARGWHMAHVSTAVAVGAAPGDGPAITLCEDDFDRGEDFGNPYSRSKFEAERVVRAAIADGLDATVHRVGGLVGDTRTGIFIPEPRGNMLYQLLRVIIGCGLVPDAAGFAMDLTPVDFAAAAVLKLSGTASYSGRTFHVRNPAQLTMPALAAILRDLGYPVVLAAPDLVARWLARDGADQADKEALPFLGQFTRPPVTVVEYDTRATTEALAGLSCPAPDPALLRTIIGHGVETGFFPKSRLWDFVTQH